jgi:diacylglycerol kinase (ATP)
VTAVVQIVGNPAAGRHKAQRIAALARAFEAARVTVHVTPCTTAPPPIRPETTHVVVAAGDGTVRHVAGAITTSGRAVALSIYPLGTINLLAREAGYPSDPAAFARMVLEREAARPHYPVALGDAYFFACAGVGPDSFAVAAVSSALKRRIGRLAYGVALARVLWTWPRPHIALTVGEQALTCEAFYVAKGRYYAGPWSFAREARVHEPTLHVVALARCRRRDYLRFVATLVAGGDVTRLANVTIMAAATITADANEPLPVQADGDIVDTLPTTMTVRETALLFC